MRYGFYFSGNLVSFGWNIKPQHALAAFFRKTNCLHWYIVFVFLWSQQHVMQSNMSTIYKNNPHTHSCIRRKKYLLTAHLEFGMAIYRRNEMLMKWYKRTVWMLHHHISQPLFAFFVDKIYLHSLHTHAHRHTLIIHVEKGFAPITITHIFFALPFFGCSHQFHFNSKMWPFSPPR